MAELEDAGFLVNRMVEIFEPGSCYAEQYDAAVVAVEADRKAVALRVLDDFEARIREQFKRVDPAWRQLLPILLREARTKYQEKP